MRKDEYFMRKALREVKKSCDNKGKVGVVIVQDGKIVSSAGSDVRTGRHAEHNALEKAGWLGDSSLKKNSVIYVTIQPCVRRTTEGFPDCCELIKRAGVEKVIYAGEDPQVGRAATEEKLRKYGVKVEQISDAELVQACRKVFDDSFYEKLG
jgi:pyrimidine deaminase RibD-like protein